MARKPVSRPSLLVLSLLATAVLAQDPPAPPRLDIPRSTRQNVGTGVTPTFRASPAGSDGFFKPDGAIPRMTAYGNLEAEILMSRLAGDQGFLAPQTRMVTVAARWTDLRFRDRAHLESEVVDARFTGGSAPAELAKMPWWWEPHLDVRDLIRLQLLDVVAGNGDRHSGNLFVFQDAEGRVRPIPLDHNLAFATRRVVPDGYWQRNFLPGFEGAELDTPLRRNQGITADRAGTPDLIMRRNSSYERVLDAALIDRGTQAIYLEEARRLVERLSDAYLEHVIGGLADHEITHGDRSARRAELLEVARIRRDLLVGHLERLFLDAAFRPGPGAEGGTLAPGRAGPTGMSSESQVRGEAGVPGAALATRFSSELGARLAAVPLTESARVHLTGLFVPGRNGMDPGLAYLQARLAGVPAELASAMVKEFVAPSGWTLTEERARGMDAFLEHPKVAEDLSRLTRPEARGTWYLSEVARIPVAVRVGEGTHSFTDARGGRIPAEHEAGLGRLVDELVRAGEVRPGETVWIRVDGFGSRGGEPRFQLEAIDASGRWRRLGGRALPAAAMVAPVAALPTPGRSPLGEGGLFGQEEPSRQQVSVGAETVFTEGELRQVSEALRSEARELAARGELEAARLARAVASRVEAMGQPGADRSLRLDALVAAEAARLPGGEAVRPRIDELVRRLDPRAGSAPPLRGAPPGATERLPPIRRVLP